MTNRRRFLQLAASGVAAGYWTSSQSLLGAQPKSAHDKIVFGAIGTGDRWAGNGKNYLNQGIGENAAKFGDHAIVCDVDAEHRARARKLRGGKSQMVVDYRRVLDRKDVDAVTIVTPDHWHVKMAIEAMKAGKDVYCEKPLTLTIDEGKQVCAVAKETGRIFQVGTQQRSEFGSKFLTAVAMVREGRLGDIKRVTAGIGGGPWSGPLPTATPPQCLDWDKWLGPAPLVDYRAMVDHTPWGRSNGHINFRWWYEYSGGKLTDWGAHHIDIAQWAIGMENSGPESIEPLEVKFPVPFENGYPTRNDQYSTPMSFKVRCLFPNGTELMIQNNGRKLGFGNGIMFEGTKGRILVNREKLVGAPVEALATNPLPGDALMKLCKGKQPGDHMGNFVECIRDGATPISDVYTHHRAMTTCHLSNIALRLNRKLMWNAETESIIDDDTANSFLVRTPRKGYETEM